MPSAKLPGHEWHIRTAYDAQQNVLEYVVFHAPKDCAGPELCPVAKEQNRISEEERQRGSN